MKYARRPIFFALAIAVSSMSAFAQTPPPSETPAVPANEAGDAASAQSTTTPPDAAPVDTTNSYDPAASTQDPAANDSSAYQENATAADSAIAADAMTDDRNDEDRDFPWGLLGLLGLLGLIPRKARVVETYSVPTRDTTVGTGSAYDSPRAP